MSTSRHPVLAALIGVVAVVALFLAGVALQAVGHPQPQAAAVTPSSSPSPSSPPRIGTKVRDGKFEFVVSGVDCSRTSVGPELLRRTAKGRYCVVSLSVRNFSAGTKYFVGRAQKAFDGRGGSYGNDELAGIYANRDTKTFLEKLGPGERVTGKLVFDVPAKVRLTRLELHDSLLSGGVSVLLSKKEIGGGTVRRGSAGRR
ncbi:hypothetical protein Aab01nite_64360 [Paractinoplanes abujensis]|uniref:DUF4352 domain-containing protein n=1 Tax=Paractinoplanes abujensis TaxID=882441 RepID=A0A7W7CQ73_9ACTN|nr:DUF4352 domain-containing protein [Actinoplanes abujensis]MBB4692653.1 hypothetical protein [Actinoplanes abujensis]GID22846.1 hypothetical protein Aab01nite_64360 [Actinoplanes abujensis]